MANRDESHLFSLAALTAHVPTAPILPPARGVDPALDAENLHLDPAPLPSSLVGAGCPTFPLAAPLGNTAESLPAVAAPTRVARGIPIVVAALLLGASIVSAAVWSSQPAPPARLGPEISTETLTPRAAAELPSDPHRELALPAPLVPLQTTPTSLEEPTPELAQEPSRPARPPRRPATQPGRDPAPPAPAPARATARDVCSHCPPHDLSCNIKCRAGS